MKQFAAAAALALCCSGRAFAGPPFLTDDPVPVDYRHSEVYVFATSDVGPSGTTVQGPAMEFNYGIAPNTQFHVQMPYVFNTPTGGTASSGYGDTEVGIKYRFVQESATHPQIAVFPAVEIATGNAAAGLGNGRTWYRLPAWAQKSWGAWTSDAGGGYAINDAPGQRSYAFGGVQLQRDIGKYLTLGGEVYFQGAATTGGLGTTFYNVGGYFKPNGTVNVLFSAGHSISGEDHAIGYLGLYFAAGPKPDKRP